MKVTTKTLLFALAAACSSQAYAGEDEAPVDEGDAQVAPEAEEASSSPGEVTAEAQPSSASASEPASGGKPVTFDFIAEAGKRVTVRDGDFSLQPPAGWEVYVNLPSLSLLMQVPHKQGEKYQRTIQVASFSGPRYIDEVTAKEYEDVIVRKFSVASASIEDYKVRNHMPIEMTDGRQGLLFYTEFKIDDVQLMQAHILVSSQTRHYLMTYSDLAEHFESEAASQFLTEAWDAMISVQLATKSPARFESTAYLAIGAGIIVLLGLLIVVYRQWRSGREYRDFANGKAGEVDDAKSNVSSLHSRPATGSSVVSLMDSNVSRITAKKSKGKPDKDVGEAMESRFTSDVEKLDSKDDVAV